MPNVSLIENKIPKSVLVLVLILAICVVLIFSLNYFFLGKALTLREKVNTLIIGMDAGAEGVSVKTAPRTDTLILTLIDPKKSKVSMLSVPGRSMVNIPNHGPGYINEASAIGGVTLTKVMVSELAGVKINHYIVIDFEGFKHLVDLIGGVEVNVDKDMRFVDADGLYTFGLSAGRQFLNGDKALKYVRFRDESLGEIGRVARQKEVLFAAFKKLRKKANLFMIPGLLKAKEKYVKTDLNTWDFLKILRFGREINPDQDIADYVLPGSLKNEDWTPEPEQIKELMDKI